MCAPKHHIMHLIERHVASDFPCCCSHRHWIKMAWYGYLPSPIVTYTLLTLTSSLSDLFFSTWNPVADMIRWLPVIVENSNRYTKITWEDFVSNNRYRYWMKPIPNLLLFHSRGKKWKKILARHYSYLQMRQIACSAATVSPLFQKGK